jgi:hypothetical protein
MIRLFEKTDAGLLVEIAQTKPRRRGKGRRVSRVAGFTYDVLWSVEEEATRDAEIKAQEEAEAERLRAAEAESAEREKRLSVIKEKLGLTDEELSDLRAALSA